MQTSSVTPFSSTNPIYSNSAHCFGEARSDNGSTPALAPMVTTNSMMLSPLRFGLITDIHISANPKTEEGIHPSKHPSLEKKLWHKAEANMETFVTALENEGWPASLRFYAKKYITH